MFDHEMKGHLDTGEDQGLPGNATSENMPFLRHRALIMLALAMATAALVRQASAGIFNVSADRRTQLEIYNPPVFIVESTNIGPFSVSPSFSTNIGVFSEFVQATINSDIEVGPQSVLVTVDANAYAKGSRPTSTQVDSSHDAAQVFGSIVFQIDTPGTFRFQVFSSLDYSPIGGRPLQDGLFSFSFLHSPGSSLPGPVPGTNYVDVSINGPLVFTGALTPDTYTLNYHLTGESMNSYGTLLSYSASETLNGFNFQATTLDCSNQPPQLYHAVTNSALTLFWSTCPVGMSLLESPNLGAGATWSAVTNKPVLNGDYLSVTIDMTNSARYYRLTNN